MLLQLKLLYGFPPKNGQKYNHIVRMWSFHRGMNHLYIIKFSIKCMLVQCLHNTYYVFIQCMIVQCLHKTRKSLHWHFFISGTESLRSQFYRCLGAFYSHLSGPWMSLNDTKNHPYFFFKCLLIGFLFLSKFFSSGLVIWETVPLS